MRLAVHADPKFRAASIRDHREMVEALELGDADFIEKITDRHLNTTCDELRRLLDLTTNMGWPVPGHSDCRHSPRGPSLAMPTGTLRAYSEEGSEESVLTLSSARQAS